MSVRCHSFDDMLPFEDMSYAYSTGIADGVAGFRRGCPNDQEEHYEQGWQQGKISRVDASLQAWDAARVNMYECLNRDD